MAGIEIISGKRGKQYIGVSKYVHMHNEPRTSMYPCPLQRMMEHFDEKYFQRWFCRPTRRSHLTEVFEELAMTYDLKNGHNDYAKVVTLFHVFSEITFATCTAQRFFMNRQERPRKSWDPRRIFSTLKETMMMMTTRMMKKTIRIWTALAAAQPLGS